MKYENKKLKDFEEKLKTQKVAVIGIGTSNIPLIDYLHEKNAEVTIFDEKEENQINKEILNKINEYKFKKSFGKNNLEQLK